MRANKHRISKKLLAQLPKVVAEQIGRLAEEYDLHSFTYEGKAARPYTMGGTRVMGWKLIAGEGDRYTVIYKNEVMSVEMVAEHNLGASGVNHGIGGETILPIGTVLITVWYYSGFGMSVYAVGEPALCAPDAGMTLLATAHL